VDNSKLVNHTNEVLFETENLISTVKDGEAGQRGFVITRNPAFLETYTPAHAKARETFNKLKLLTADNPIQQSNLAEADQIIEDRFKQMEKVISLVKYTVEISEEMKAAQDTELLRGKQLMDQLRIIVNRMKLEEYSLLEQRNKDLAKYVEFTPLLIIFAAVVSILISLFSFIKIRKEVNDRVRKQEEDERKYTETAERIAMMESVTRRISEGEYSVRSLDTEPDQLGKISSALNTMTISLEKTFTELESHNWQQSCTVLINDAMRGQTDEKILTGDVMKAITSCLNVKIGALYVNDTSGHYMLSAEFACTNPPLSVRPGEGILGQSITNRKTIILDEVPEGYFKISSALGEASPEYLVAIPFLFNNEPVGALELGFLKKPTAAEIELLENTKEAIGIGINTAISYRKMQLLLEETQAQSEELQAQHNEMENLNAELEAQTEKLQASEEELKVQQEELQQTNEELEERSGLLEERNLEVQRKAEELEQSTKYKSQFLANMSHELRTPLNSILLLSRLLSDNNEKNLSDEQIEFANVIQGSGQGLLGLIDEILDLSKIEAGKMELEYAEVLVEDIVHDMNGLFKEVAKSKKIDFVINVEAGLKSFETDKVRLEQIIKNLISNALKFTSKGAVTLSVKKQPENDKVICFSVTDTGIGILPEKQHLIFEAFQQADGTTKRKYGGTGLGLSISRELSRLLGGEITLKSEPNKGSEFTLCVPVSKANTVTEPFTYKPVKEDTAVAEPASIPVNKYLSLSIPKSIPDDRDSITGNDKVILIVEDDTNFAKSLLDYTRKKGYKGIVAVRGDEGIRLASLYKPLGILLDLQLPVKSGWEVMDELKKNGLTRHIPVHMMSSHKVKKESITKGAADFIDKPVALEQMNEIFKKIEHVLSGSSKKVLIIEDNAKHAKALAYFLSTCNVSSEVQSDISTGLSTLNKKEVDCVILDMGIPDMKAYETLEQMKKNHELENVPVIIFTGKSLSLAEEQKIKQYADSIVIKTAHSYQRMLDEVSLFLHIVEENKSSTTTRSSSNRRLGAMDEVLNGKTVLIADDDVRNIFSLSKALESFKMNVITAMDGKEAMQKLNENPEIDILLLDMMMPKMDGYETASKIREDRKWNGLPIIAVTAKAMIGDREKCISAGASDYITKPVDIDQLMSLLRVWLYDKSN
jgi:signal transduction histidine kinase/DNA-binding response OmpR family regulator/CHASE3 domain sensor protein